MKASAAELKAALTTALSEVALAEAALETALAALVGGPRAEKVAVTNVVAEAFTRLQVAHHELSKMRDAFSDD
jgi:hypothetical protein